RGFRLPRAPGSRPGDRAGRGLYHRAGAVLPQQGLRCADRGYPVLHARGRVREPDALPQAAGDPNTRLVVRSTSLHYALRLTHYRLKRASQSPCNAPITPPASAATTVTSRTWR